MRACAAISLGLTALLAAACASPSQAPADTLNAALWQQRSEEYALVAGGVWKAAGRELERALADSAWDAVPPSERRGGQGSASALPPCVVVDVDETVLDNAVFETRLLRGDGSASWAQWVQEASAQPVPGSLEFLRDVAARGATIVYLTNRTASEREATLRNLAEAGFPAGEYLGVGFAVPGCTDRKPNKTCRRRWVAERYRVLFFFGDQLSDFLDVGDNRPEDRKRAMDEAPAWFGERWFVLPNATYGSWLDAWAGPDDLPDAERGRRKRAALRSR